MKMVIACAAAALLFGCYENSRTIVESPVSPTPGPIEVEAAGSVRPLSAGLQMQDGSVCRQGGVQVHCASVSWQVKSSASGIIVDSRVGVVGGTVQVDGLAPGCYTILQTARASDGNSDDQVHNKGIQTQGCESS